MSKYIYAVCVDYENHIYTQAGASLKDAEEKIIEEYRNSYEIDEEFDNYREFCQFMSENYEVDFSELTDVETL